MMLFMLSILLSVTSPSYLLQLSPLEPDPAFLGLPLLERFPTFKVFGRAPLGRWQSMPVLKCPGCSLSCRSYRILSFNMKSCRRSRPRERAQALLDRVRNEWGARQASQERLRQPEARRYPSEAEALAPQGLPVAAVPPLARTTRWKELDPIAAFGNERTYVYFMHTLHAGGFSHKKAATAIAGQLTTTSSDPEPLILEAANGLRHGYAIVDRISDSIGLSFTTHRIPITFGSGPSAIHFTATMHLRSLLSLCKLGFSRVSGAQHCIPRVSYYEGRRVYSGSYTGKWAEQHFKAIREVDMEGLLWSVDVAWDKSSLSNVQSAYPLYVKFNAWP